VIKDWQLRHGNHGKAAGMKDREGRGGGGGGGDDSNVFDFQWGRCDLNWVGRGVGKIKKAKEVFAARTSQREGNGRTNAALGKRGPGSKNLLRANKHASKSVRSAL